MRTLIALIAGLGVGACSIQEPAGLAPEADEPERISSEEWKEYGGNDPAHLMVGEDGVAGAWVRVESAVRRTQRTGEPNYGPVQRKYYVWVEADCDAKVVRLSDRRDYEDAQLVTTPARERSVAWAPARNGLLHFYYSVCAAAREQGLVDHLPHPLRSHQG